MFHIVSFNEDEGDIALYEMSLRDKDPTNREGPCEDDAEVTAPFIGMMPEECGKVNGSPLKFCSYLDNEREIDRQIQAAFERGL